MLKIHDCSSLEFKKYGTYLGKKYDDIVSYLTNNSPMPEKNNLYVRDDEKMHNLPSYDLIKEEIYGNSNIEIGYCNGYNYRLNCLEYHTCPEVDIASTDLILLLATQDDIKDGMIDSHDVKAFLLKKGEAIIINPYIFHFSPIKLSDDGFKSCIILTDGTNRDLEKKPSDPRLWKENKWLFAHKDTVQANSGAYIGIKGDNIEYICQ